MKIKNSDEEGDEAPIETEDVAKETIETYPSDEEEVLLDEVVEEDEPNKVVIPTLCISKIKEEYVEEDVTMVVEDINEVPGVTPKSKESIMMMTTPRQPISHFTRTQVTRTNGVPKCISHFESLLMHFGFAQKGAFDLSAALYTVLGDEWGAMDDNCKAAVRTTQHYGSSFCVDEQMTMSTSSGLVTMSMEPVKLPPYAAHIEKNMDTNHYVGLGVLQPVRKIKLDKKALPDMYVNTVLTMLVSGNECATQPIPIFVGDLIEKRVTSYLRITSTTTHCGSEDPWMDETTGGDKNMLFPCQAFAVPICEKKYFRTSTFRGSQMVTIHISRSVLSANTVRNLFFGDTIETVHVENCIIVEPCCPGAMRNLTSMYWDVTCVPRSSVSRSTDVFVDLDFAKYPNVTHLTLRCDRRSVVPCTPETGHGLVVSVHYTRSSVFHIQNAQVLHLKYLTLAAPHADFYEDSNTPSRECLIVSHLHRFTSVSTCLNLIGAPMQDAASAVYINRKTDLWYGDLDPRSASLVSTTACTLCWYVKVKKDKYMVPVNCAHCLMKSVSDIPRTSRHTRVLMGAMGRLVAPINLLCSSLVLQLLRAKCGISYEPTAPLNDLKIIKSVMAHNKETIFRGRDMRVFASPYAPYVPLWHLESGSSPSAEAEISTEDCSGFREAVFEEEDGVVYTPLMPSMGKKCVSDNIVRSLRNRGDKWMRPKVPSSSYSVDGLGPNGIIIYKVTPELHSDILRVRSPNSRVSVPNKERNILLSTIYVPPYSSGVPSDKLCKFSPPDVGREDVPPRVDVPYEYLQAEAHAEAYGLWRTREQHVYEEVDLGYIVCVPYVEVHLPPGSMNITIKSRDSVVAAQIEDTLKRGRMFMESAHKSCPMTQDALFLYGKGRPAEGPPEQEAWNLCTIQ